MGSVLSTEVMALDDAGEALADGHALHVDLLADLEDLDADFGADLELAELFGLGETEFLEHVPGLHCRLGEMPGDRLGDARGATLAECDLHGGIAVLLRGLDLRHAVVGHVEHRDGLRAAVVGEDARHADLAADQSYRHTFLFC